MNTKISLKMLSNEELEEKDLSHLTIKESELNKREKDA